MADYLNSGFGMPSHIHPVDLTLSIVSHGQGRLIENLLKDLQRSDLKRFEIILTLNVPESEDFLQPFQDLPIVLVRNDAPKGFGSNHNAAFARSTGARFAIVNPDIRANPLDVQPLLEMLKVAHVGACGPMVLAPHGDIEDSARRFPTPAHLFRRIVTGRRAPDYDFGPDSAPVRVDWLAGMFVIFPREAFAAVDGFDERFFMYMEDADICRRLTRAGWTCWLVPAAAVVHNAQRASQRDLRHLCWHLTSAFRYFTGF